jgi:hypothetical protein
MAAVLTEMDDFRLQNMYRYAGWIAATGPLRVDTRRAGEILCALASPDVGRMLCDELGWTQTQHAEWLADALIRTLLPDQQQPGLRSRSSGRSPSNGPTRRPGRQP